MKSPGMGGIDVIFILVQASTAGLVIDTVKKVAHTRLPSVGFRC